MTTAREWLEKRREKLANIIELRDLPTDSPTPETMRRKAYELRKLDEIIAQLPPSRKR